MHSKPSRQLFNESIYKNLMFSLPLVCLILSILQTTAKIIFQNNPCELGVSSVLEVLKCSPQHFLQKRINLDFKVVYNLSSMYYSGLIFHYFLHTDIHLSSNSTTPLFLHICTLSIFSFHAYPQGVLTKWYTPGLLPYPTYTSKSSSNVNLSMESFQKAP